MDERAEAGPAKDGAAGLAAAFLAARDPLALLRDRGARLDTSFADSGTWEFVLPGVAETGSQLSIQTGSEPGSAGEDLSLALPATQSLTLAQAEGLWGKARRLPAMPARPWLYEMRGAATVDGRTARIIASLSADPASPASRVRQLDVLREAILP